MWQKILDKFYRRLEIGGYSGIKELSNFYPYEFIFRNIKFVSMEALLQGIKFSDLEKQKKCFEKVGKKAKFYGKKSNWKIDQTLYFQSKPMKRSSLEYQEFLFEAFRSLFSKNEEAKSNLLKTTNYRLIHRIGKNKINETVLTEKEFCEILMHIRAELKDNK